jgi:hypothetical protein
MLTGLVTLVKGSAPYEFKLDDHGGSNQRQLIVKRRDPSCIEVNVIKAEKGNYEQSLTMKAGRANCVTTLQVYEARYAKGAGRMTETPTSLSLNVKVVPRIELPPLESEEGMVARLLLAESLTPNYGNFDNAKVLEGMRWMYLVLQNRLSFSNLGEFSVPKGGARNLFSIIKAPGQFAGFEGYPNNIGGEQLKHINEILGIANKGGLVKFEQYRKHVENALDIASGRIPLVSDPCPTGLYGWRTANAKHPGSNFEFYKLYAGQDFYTLKKEFLSQHNKGQNLK